MRNKEPKHAPLGVADGLEFGMDVEDETTEKDVASVTNSDSVIIETQPAEKKKGRISTKAEIDPNRNYSPYYTPKPKKGSKGGTLGRGAVDASERKVQFSLTCTPAQKERFTKAAKADKRKLPDFICLAVEEYIENHGL